MPDREKVFDAIRNCITEPKCKDCPWKECEKVGHKRVEVPVTLMLDALQLLKEQQETITSLQGTIHKLSASLGERPEQKHGAWLTINHPVIGMKSLCSVCKLLANEDYRFCPHCGAKMDD